MGGPCGGRGGPPEGPFRRSAPGVGVVVKVGGSLSAAPGLAARLRPIHALREGGGVAVVPGGGAFADAVRDAARLHRLDPSTSHWMAILAMDQVAHLLLAVLEDAVLVRDGPGVLRAAGRDLPIVAPYDWLRREDPLPHTWEVTADSIAAWIAGRLGARRLVLVKSGPDRAGVDAYFERALPPGIVWEVVTPRGGEWHRIL